MTDAVPLPPRPNVEQYRKLAREFQKACKTADSGAVREWAAKWAETLARLQAPPDTQDVRRESRRYVERILRQWDRLQKSNKHVAQCTLAGGQLLIARCHGFVNWPKFLEHMESIERSNSSVSQFEAAVEAIIAGDADRLEKLLRGNPELALMRSTREHRSTLLHYVSANGVENYRQKTPKNIVEIAKLLLDAGADVNAESDAYGGGSTTLGLTATSYHPEAAGVQIALMDLLIERGARINGPGSGNGVNACLRNGRGTAAEYLANRGARLDLEGAAGVGRLEVVKGYFDEAGGLKPPATLQQLLDGFAWACEFGRISVVGFLLDHGVSADTKLIRGTTGLHWAALAGHGDIVGLLLARGAVPEIIDDTHHATPLGWALHGWGNRPAREKDQAPFYETVALLVRAGCRVDPRWLESGPDGEDAAAGVRSDPRMMAALRGEGPGSA